MSKQNHTLKKVSFRLLEDYELIVNKSLPNPNEFMGHPINSFIVIKHLTNDLNSAVGYLNTNEQFISMKPIVLTIYKSNQFISYSKTRHCKRLERAACVS